MGTAPQLAQVQAVRSVGGPEPIEKGIAADLRMRALLDDAPLAPISATFTLLDGSLNAVVSARACTIATDGWVTVALVAGDTSGQVLGDGWRGVWSLVTTAGTTTIERDYCLCRKAIACPVVTQDLYEIHPSLRTSLPTGQTSFAPQIRQAWIRVTERLYAKGRRPWLILSASALREVTIAETLKLVFRDAKSPNPRFAELLADYEKAAIDAWAELRFEYDTDDDGRGEGQRSASPVLHLSAGPARRAPYYP